MGVHGAHALRDEQARLVFARRRPRRIRPAPRLGWDGDREKSSELVVVGVGDTGDRVARAGERAQHRDPLDVRVGVEALFA